MAVVDPLTTIDVDTNTQEILLAARNHDLAALKPYLRTPGAASVQDLETGFTPLHAAIDACGPAKSNQSFHEFPDETTKEHERATSTSTDDDGGSKNDENEDSADLEAAKATVHELFMSGAIWNDLDINDETPGCLAWRLGQKELYELVVQAGVRAEMLMNLMGGYEQLASDDEDDEMDEEDEEIEDTTISVNPRALPVQTLDSERQALPESTMTTSEDVNSKDYLASSLTFTPSNKDLLDSSHNGVMMSWETPVMDVTAKLLSPVSSHETTPVSGPRVLNIGHGLGIIDGLFASQRPSAHHIIEAHPDVLQHLESVDNTAFGPAWRAASPDNVLHAGKWQDVVPRLLEQGEQFDIIYFDTFGESYTQLKMFFTELVPGLLSQDGKFSFFNGLGADRRVCYDVYCRVVELDLCDAGLDVEWTNVGVDLDGSGLSKENEGQWEGIRRRYWTLDEYRLPICTFMT